MPAGSTFDPFYQNLRTFFSQHTAQTGKQLGLNEMYGLTTGEMATQLAAKRIADQTALERERLALSAGQTAQQLRQQKILEERRLAEMEKTGASTREAQAWQNRATKQNIEAAPWRTAISGIQALGSAGLAGASWWDRLNYRGGTDFSRRAMDFTPSDVPRVDLSSYSLRGNQAMPRFRGGEDLLYNPSSFGSGLQTNFGNATDFSDWSNGFDTDTSSGIIESPVYTE